MCQPTAASAATLAVSLNAPTLATISVTTGGGITSVTGLIRSSRNQVSRIVVSAAPSAQPASFAMTCADRSKSSLHGTLTLADAAIVTPGSDVTCAAWAANPAGNVIALDGTITFANVGQTPDASLDFTVSLVVS